jgi:hypothetical protein
MRRAHGLGELPLELVHVRADRRDPAARERVGDESLLVVSQMRWGEVDPPRRDWRGEGSGKDAGQRARHGKVTRG